MPVLFYGSQLPAVKYLARNLKLVLFPLSSCSIGLDCVNNESFGFDTIRLKENNTRIKFEDTSVGSFPTNDWQLTANDSASGASSKFSIEDITEHGQEVVEIGARMRGLLEELEKAHIYISTLNDRIGERDSQLAKLEQRNSDLAERLARIEAMLSAANNEKK